MNVLVINCSSATIEFQLLSSVSGLVIRQGKAERVHEKTGGYRSALQELLTAIRAAREIFPSLVHMAVFDTAFPSRMPKRATTSRYPGPDNDETLIY